MKLFKKKILKMQKFLSNKTRSAMQKLVLEKVHTL